MNRLFLFTLLFISACASLKRNVDPDPKLYNVTVAIQNSAFQIPFPQVTKLAEVGEGIKEIDINSFDYALVKANQEEMQFAVTWRGKTWEFQGTCSHTQMRVKLVLGENSVKVYEPDDWALEPPNTMQFQFIAGNGNINSAYVSCRNGVWYYDN